MLPRAERAKLSRQLAAGGYADYQGCVTPPASCSSQSRRLAGTGANVIDPHLRALQEGSAADKTADLAVEVLKDVLRETGDCRIAGFACQLSPESYAGPDARSSYEKIEKVEGGSVQEANEIRSMRGSSSGCEIGDWN